MMKLRLQLGMTQNDIAGVVGMKQEHWSRIERGAQTNLHLARLYRIAEALDVHPRYLLQSAPESSLAPAKKPKGLLLNLETIRARRETLGLMQKDAASNAGMLKQNWYAIESGRAANILLNTLDAMAKTLQLHPGELLI